MKKTVNLLILLCGLAILTIVSYNRRPHIINSAPWHDNGQIIAHAMGAVDGIEYTNSKDAFLTNYERGIRVFEVDFLKTSDDKLVLRHSWKDPIQEGIDKDNIPTEEEFLNTPIMGKYTPLNIDDLFEIMRNYPDIFIITDTKGNIESCIYDIVDIASKSNNEDLLDRFVIQIYEQGQEKRIREIYDFNNFIFTLYKTDFNGSLASFIDIINYCSTNNIDTVTMWDAWWYSPYSRYKNLSNVKVYTHTVNDKDAAFTFFSDGVDGIYTDSLTKDQIGYPFP